MVYVKQGELTPTQAKCLLRKYAIGDASGFNWSTVAALLNRGYLALSEDKKSIHVTAKGREYCDAHHMEIV